MADEKVVLDVNVQESGSAGGGRGSSRRFEQEREDLARVFAESGGRISSMIGLFTKGKQQPEREPLTLHGTSRQRLRELGVFLGEGAAQESERRQRNAPGPGGRGGGGGGGGGSPIGRPRPFQAGQIFTGGPISRTFGLRAAGLATAGFAGATFLAVDQAINRLIQTVRDLNSVYQQQIQVLTEFSGPLTLAAAQREARFISTRASLAQRYGPTLAEQFRNETRFRVAVMEFMASMSVLIQPVLEFITNGGTVLARWGRWMADNPTITNSIKNALGRGFGMLAWVIPKLNEWLDRRLDEGDEENLRLMHEEQQFWNNPARQFQDREQPPTFVEPEE